MDKLCMQTIELSAGKNMNNAHQMQQTWILKYNIE